MIKRIGLYSVVGVLIILFSILVGNYAKPIGYSIMAKKGETAPTIIIDAGHGGEDGGAQSIDGKTLEKDVNLAIAKDLKEIFLLAGFQVEMIREEDTAIYDNDAKSLRNKKVSDLRKRVEIANSNPNNVLISIHQNQFESSKYLGTQIFYSTNNPESNILAEYVKKAVVGLMQPANTRETKPANNSIYLLSKATIPAIIVECGFLSNAEESKKLIDPNYQKQMAFTIYCGFLDYYNSK